MKIFGMIRSRITRRKHPRTNVIATAWLRLKDDPLPLVCVLWDVSEGGARMTVANVAAIPEKFSLLGARDAVSGTSCRVVWRSNEQIGIQFLDNADAILHLAKPERVSVTQ